MAKVPKKFHEVFWEVNPEKIDTDKNPEYVIERILEYGTLEGVKWLRKTLGDDKIKEYVTGSGRRRLSTITINFWQIILKIGPEQCMSISSLKNRSPFWKY